MSLADKFLFSDVTGTGLSCVDEGIVSCGGFSRSSGWIPSVNYIRKSPQRFWQKPRIKRGWSTEYQSLLVEKAMVIHISHSCIHIDIYINMMWCLYNGFSIFFSHLKYDRWEQLGAKETQQHIQPTLLSRSTDLFCPLSFLSHPPL